MAVMECPHCEEGIDSLTRTGDKKYSCGQCNMVIKYDDVAPHLDDFNVNDKRGDGGSDDSEPPSMMEDLPAPPTGGDGGGQEQGQGPPQQQQQQQDWNQQEASLSDRERVYMNGTEGLKKIKRERLENWLAQSEGVGSQTQQRILMVFQRNDSVHRNPHVLYNLLEDELSASGSYINTMVEDIFAPEEEHADLLESQGYTPWNKRSGAPGGQPNMGGQQGGMNPAAGSNFGQPNQGGMRNQQQQAPQQQQQQQQGGMQQAESSDSVSRQEMEMMMQQMQAEMQEQDEGGRGVLDGLSDATDEAIREAAGNIGGLAGTMHKVFEEAMVGYARDNPEWVINNMDVIQKFMSATDEADFGGQEQANQQPEQDSKVDDALSNLGGQNQQQQPRQQQSQYNNRQQRQPQQQNRQPQSNPQPQEARRDIPDTNQQQQSTDHQPSGEENPDIDSSMMGESDFDPNMGSVDPMSAGPDQDGDESKDGEESEQSDVEDTDDSFDDLFGDVQA